MSILGNVKILDLTRVISGPWATQLLADMGATVYKVEEPDGGDWTRKVSSPLEFEGEKMQGYTAFYLGANRGKQSIQIDLAKPEGAQLVRELAARCDAIVENYKAGGLVKFGLDYDSIRKNNPKVIYCSITGFGIDGPYAKRPAYDFILQGLAGLMSTCGQPDGSPGAMPMRTSIPATDLVAGLYASSAILAALLHRGQTGVGQFIDIGMIDSAVAMNGHLALEYLITGNPPGRIGNSNPVASPSDVFECLDGHIIIAAASTEQFIALCGLLGHMEWSTDPRFTTPPLRVANRPVLNALILAITRTDTRAKWLAALEQAGVPSGPINTMDEVFEDPQVRHRGLQISLPHPGGFEVPSLRNPIRMSETPFELKAPPLLGEHTEAILAQELGMTTSQIDALRDKGAIGGRIRDG